MVDLTAEMIGAIKPSLRQVPVGWLAISEPLSPLRIAVIGDTEPEARASFAAAIARWAVLHGQPESSEKPVSV